MAMDTGQQVDVTEQRNFFAGTNPYDFIHAAPLEVQALEKMKAELLKEIARLQVVNSNQGKQIKEQGDRLNTLQAENETLLREGAEGAEEAAGQNRGTIDTLRENLAMLEMELFGVLYPIYCRNYFTYNYIIHAQTQSVDLAGDALFEAVDGLAPKTKTVNDTRGEPYNRRWSDQMKMKNSIKNDCALAVLIYQWMTINQDHPSWQYNIPPDKKQVAEIANRYFKSIGGVIANVVLPLSMALAMYKYWFLRNQNETFKVALDFYPTLDYYEYTFFSYSNSIDNMPKGFNKKIPHTFDSKQAAY